MIIPANCMSTQWTYLLISLCLTCNIEEEKANVHNVDWSILLASQVATMNDGNHTMPDANNMTVLTRLASCDHRTLNLTGVAQHLYYLYQNNLSNPTARLFSNVSITNSSCTQGAEGYFVQLLTFTQSVPIRTQALFASVYSDYLNTNDYRLHGLTINRNIPFTLSSITVNNSALSDVCSSADAAHDALCRTNLTHPVCTVQFNRWNFKCSASDMNTTPLETTAVATGLNTWQLALVCSLSIVFVLVLLLLFGYLFRRYTRTKQIALSRSSLYDNPQLMQKAGIPHKDVFQRTTAIVQPKVGHHTATSWVQKETVSNVAHRNKPISNSKPVKLDDEETFTDCTNAHDSTLPSNTTQISTVSSNDMPDNTVLKTTAVFRSTSDRAVNDFKPSIDDSRDELNSSSLNQSSLNDSRTPLTGQVNYGWLNEEDLSDEDAWMSILDVVNAELAILEEQDQIRIPM